MSNLLKLQFLLITGLILWACVSTPEMKNTWVFQCPDGFRFTAEYSRDFNDVVIKADAFSAKMRRAEAASGMRYTKDTAVFWAKGGMALLDIDENNVHRDCRGDTG